VRVQSKKQSIIEVETRTSMKGSAIRASSGSAGAKAKEQTMSTINSEKNPPSEGIKKEIHKNAQMSNKNNMNLI
jgi:hypothetical protein